MWTNDKFNLLLFYYSCARQWKLKNNHMHTENWSPSSGNPTITFYKNVAHNISFHFDKIAD